MIEVEQNSVRKIHLIEVSVPHLRNLRMQEQIKRTKYAKKLVGGDRQQQL